MENFESAQTRSTHASHCQPGRHPANMVIRPAIHRKVLALIAKTDAVLAKAEAKLPKETRAWFGAERTESGFSHRVTERRYPTTASQESRFSDAQRRYLNPRNPDEPTKARKPYVGALRIRKRERGVCIGYSCTAPVPAGRSRCPGCAEIRKLKRPSRARV